MSGPYRAEFGAIHHESASGHLFTVAPASHAETVATALNKAERRHARHPLDPIPWEDAPLDTPLWAVCGSRAFPTVFACRLSNKTGPRVIWGFSTHEGVPGYRTLGRGVDWAMERAALLFTTRTAAFAYIEALFQQSDAR